MFTVYADAQLYKDLWWNYRVWLQQFRDVDGFYGLHVNMPITPNQVFQGQSKGTNALGLDANERNTTLGGKWSRTQQCKHSKLMNTHP